MTIEFIRPNGKKVTAIRLRGRIALIKNGDKYKKESITGCTLDSQNLESLNFMKAELQNTKLINCNCNRCDFFGSDLRGADLTGTSLVGCDLRKVEIDDNTKLPHPIVWMDKSFIDEINDDGYEHAKWKKWDIIITPYNLQIGCQSHAIDVWKILSDRAIDDMAVTALEFWTKYGDSILSECYRIRDEFINK